MKEVSSGPPDAAIDQSAKPRAKRAPRITPEQPVEIINIAGAQLKLETLAVLSGYSINSLYREAKRGRLQLTKSGKRCTRVTSENARAYLDLLAKGAA